MRRGGRLEPSAEEPFFDQKSIELIVALPRVCYQDLRGEGEEERKKEKDKVVVVVAVVVLKRAGLMKHNVHDSLCCPSPYTRCTPRESSS